MSTNEPTRQEKKFDLWERKLLDLTTRNALLNTKVKGKTVPVFVKSASDIEDNLSSDKEYAIISRNAAGQSEATEEAPAAPLIPAKEYEIEDLVDTASFDEVLTKGIDGGTLYSSLAEKDLDDRLKYLYRTSRVAAEDDGSGTLFLACGFLKWTEDNKEQPCYAPIVLVPVELKRKFGVGKYVMQKSDDDASVNITLLEKLRKDFDLITSELEGDVPQDNSGADVKGVFKTLEAIVALHKDWKIIDACVLGMFSFSQFVMWNDLHNHREEIAANKIVKSLLDGELSWEYEDMEGKAKGFNDEGSIYLPISADSSQAYAIKRAGEGASFVLHGPPGTGKSQTITSMIANAIANNQKVLFVAEKKAALEVVYSRLKKIGLDPFCLELYSNKIAKGYISDQLKAAMEVRLNMTSEGDYEKALADITARRAELDAYSKALLTRTESGYTLYELLSIYADNEDAPEITLEDGFENGLTEDRINASKAAIGEFLASGSGMSGVLPYVKATEYSQDTKIKLKGELDELSTAADNVITTASAVSASYPNLSAGVNIASAHKAAAIIGNFFKARSSILQTWDAQILTKDPDQLKAAFNEANSKWGPFKSSAIKKVYASISSFDKSGSAKDDLGKHIDTLCDYKNAFTALGFNTAAGIPEILPAFTTSLTEFDEVASKVNTRLGIAEIAPDSQAGFDKVQVIVNDIRINEAKIRDKTILNHAAESCSTLKLGLVVNAYEQGIVNEGNIVNAFDRAWSVLLICKMIDGNEVLRNFSGKVYKEKISQLRKMSDEFTKLTQQEVALKVAKTSFEMRNNKDNANASSGLGKLSRAIKGRCRGVSIRSLFREVQEVILKLTPCVLMSPMSAAQFIAPSMDPLFDLVIFDEASQLPTSEAVGVLARGKNAIIVGDPNQMPPTTFFRLQVNNADTEDYDTEDLESILDDCLAVGMPQSRLLWHYRSRHESLITFSNRSFYDSKLYTFPSVDDRSSRVTLVKCEGSFDSGKSRTNEKEAKAVVDELVMRSRDPELSKLTHGIVTFNIQQQSLIEDMIDEVCKTDEAFERWAYGGEETIFIKNLENVQGDERDVILFSVGYGPDAEGKVSMNFGPLNKDGGWRRLNVAVTRSRCGMKVFSSLSPEQLRISDATPEGVKAFKRFLQYAEGSTIWDQDLVNADSLDSSGLPIIDRSLKYRGVIEDIRAGLKERGYDSDAGVGKSGFKVDIGVRREGEESYCLGILIDGSSDINNSTASTREISQPSVLKGLGWKVIRVWSLDWWENKDAVIEECIAEINRADVPDPEPDPPAAEPVPAEAAPENPEETEETQKKTELITDTEKVPYKTADITLPQLTPAQFADEMNISELTKAARQIIAAEAPLTTELFAQRLCDACGITRKTAAVKNRVDYILKALKNTVTLQNITLCRASENDRQFIWKEPQDAWHIMSYYRVPGEGMKVRKADDIPVEEAACAAIAVCRAQFGMPRDALVTETGRALGFSVVAPMVKLLCEQAIDLAIERGQLTGSVRMIKPLE